MVRVALLFSLISAAVSVAAQNPLQVASPNGQIVFVLSSGTALGYSISFRGKPLIDQSELGLDLQGQPTLGPSMHSVGAKPGSTDENYTIPVGKTKERPRPLQLPGGGFRGRGWHQIIRGGTSVR